VILGSIVFGQKVQRPGAGAVQIFKGAAEVDAGPDGGISLGFTAETAAPGDREDPRHPRCR
jgi:hypothetical protein